MKRFVLLCALVPVVFSAARAYEVFEPTQDSFILCFYYEGEEHGGIYENYGDSVELWVADFSDYPDYVEHEDTVIQFDISDITPDMNLLRVYLNLDIEYYDGWWGFFSIEEEWNEMEITWSNAPPTGECFLEHHCSSNRRIRTIELPADYIQGWVDNPDENFGFRIVQEVLSMGMFMSRETSSPPQLIVYLESDDTGPPACSESYPADGESGVPPDSTIAFELTDDLAGIDTDTIQFALDLEEERTTANRDCLSIGSSSNTIIEGTLEIDGEDPLDVLCTFTPSDDLPWGDYTCTVDGNLADTLGNEMGEDYVWTFDTYGRDDDPPEVADLSPGDGEDDVPPNAVITFHLTDAYAGVDVSTLAFTVRDGSLQPASLRPAKFSSATLSRSGDVEGELELDAADLCDVSCTFTPAADLPPGPVTCTVAGSLEDRDGNALGDDFSWTFSVGGSAEHEESWGEIKAAF
jgi:hypothetical protein